MGPAEHERFLIDFVTDLGDLNPQSVQKACKAWRNSDAKRFPTPGHLRKLAVDYQPAIPGPKPELWRPISEGEYANLTIEEKIRQHRLLADRENLDAARKWRKLPETIAGKPPSFMDFSASLPAEWAAHRARERNHYDEIKRLKELLKKHEPQEHAT